MVYYGKAPGVLPLSVDAGNLTSFTVSGLLDDTYYFAVKAYDTGHTVESGFSNEVSGPTTPSAGCQVSVTGLVAAYGFDEASGTAALDSSGKGNHGVIKEAVRIAGGKYGKALQFDGINDWVTVNDSATLDLSTGMTLEAWVFPTASADGRSIIFKEQAGGLVYSLYSNDSVANVPISKIFNGTWATVAGTTALPLNQWSHLVSTYNQSFHRIYVNGVKVGEASFTGTLSASTGVLRIGGNGVWPDFFKGNIDTVRIYNRALTDAEVVNNFSATTCG